MATYELWETRSGNLMESFSSESEALAAVADVIERFGGGYAESIALVFEDNHGRSKLLAEGVALAERVRNAGVKSNLLSA